VKPFCPVRNLPGVVGSPEELNGNHGQLLEPARNLQRVLWVVVRDLVLESARLADRAADELEVDLERLWVEPVRIAVGGS
jgi:hypothetical protein